MTNRLWRPLQSHHLKVGAGPPGTQDFPGSQQSPSEKHGPPVALTQQHLPGPHVYVSHSSCVPRYSQQSSSLLHGISFTGETPWLMQGGPLAKALAAKNVEITGAASIPLATPQLKSSRRELSRPAVLVASACGTLHAELFVAILRPGGSA